MLDKRYKHDIAVVVDRLVMRHDVRKRLADSIETAVGLADGLVEIEIVGRGSGRRPPPGVSARGRRRPWAGGARDRGEGARAAAISITPDMEPDEGTIFTFSERFACPEHGPSLVELEPRIFSFNSPQGACERCTGLGSQLEIDPELVVPGPGAVDRRGRARAVGGEQLQLLRADHRGDRRALRHRPRHALGGPRPRGTRRVPVRDRRRARSTSPTATATGAGAPTRPASRASSATSSAATARPTPSSRARRSRSSCRCARARSATARACGRSRARCWSPGRGSRTSCALSARRALEWLEDGRAVGDRPPRRAADPARDLRAPAVPRERRHRLPLDGPRGGDAVGRRGAADPAGDPDRLARWSACSTSSTSPRSACTSATTRS